MRFFVLSPKDIAGGAHFAHRGYGCHLELLKLPHMRGCGIAYVCAFCFEGSVHPTTFTNPNGISLQSSCFSKLGKVCTRFANRRQPLRQQRNVRVYSKISFSAALRPLSTRHLFIYFERYFRSRKLIFLKLHLETKFNKPKLLEIGRPKNALRRSYSRKYIHTPHNY